MTFNIYHDLNSENFPDTYASQDLLSRHDGANVDAQVASGRTIGWNWVQTHFQDVVEMSVGLIGRDLRSLHSRHLCGDLSVLDDIGWVIGVNGEGKEPVGRELKEDAAQ